MFEIYHRVKIGSVLLYRGMFLVSTCFFVFLVCDEMKKMGVAFHV